MAAGAPLPHEYAEILHSLVSGSCTPEDGSAVNCTNVDLSRAFQYYNYIVKLLPVDTPPASGGGGQNKEEVEGAKCSKTRLRASLIPKFSLGDTPNPC